MKKYLHKKIVSIFCIGLLLLSAVLLITPIAESAKAQNTARVPIYIDGNSGFTEENGVTSGLGTQANPYIIENWDINASSANGIEIRNTNGYFIVRNCIIHDGHHGIYFSNVTNGKIEKVTSYNNYYGISLICSSNNQISNCTVNDSWFNIRLYESSDCLITNCTVYCSVWSNDHNFGIHIGGGSNNCISNCVAYNNFQGIVLSSSYNILTNCTIYNNSEYGIYLYWDSNNNQITNCTVYNNYCGIELYGSSNNIFRNNTLENNTYNFGVFGGKGDASHFYQDIDTSNTINDKPIYYITEQNNLIFDDTMNIGYLGLVSCNNITVKNLTLADNFNGLLLANTSSSIITNCTFYSNVYNLFLSYYSNNNLIINCDISSGYYGIFLVHSSNNQIINCTIHNNFWSGIYLFDSSNNQITNCIVDNNTDIGIQLSDSSNNNITNCAIYNNFYGVWLGYYSNNNKITYCDIIDNANYGVYIHCEAGGLFRREGMDMPSCYNVFYHNNFINNVQNACDPYTNYWDDGYPNGGNYWSDYTGIDEDGDGISDTPYYIPGGANMDNHPFMDENGWLIYKATPVGDDVIVEFAEEGVTITFENITAPGTTTATITETGPPPSIGFKLVPYTPPTYYQIITTASYMGIINVSINYDETQVGGLEKNLKLKQYNETLDEWVDITTWVDTVNNIIYGETTSFSFFAVMETTAITAAVDIDPDTLNLKSKGKWITCYIELPTDYNVNNINISTVLLNDQIVGESHPTNTGDYNNNGIPDLMVKFDRAEVKKILNPGEEVIITVTWQLLDGTVFTGSDVIKVI